MKNVTLRTATATDADFAFECEAKTMREYALAAWGDWPQDQFRARAFENAAAGRTQIIELEGKPIGILRVERCEDCYRLKQIFILPEYQRRGIGTTIIRQLIKEASEKGVRIRLRVLNVNPARNLYGRLGFSLVESTQDYQYLEHAS